MAVTLLGQRKLIIKELGGEKRELVLTGSAMPFSPTAFGGGRTRVVKTMYPGNPVASGQVLGTDEEDDSFSGRWRDAILTTTGKVLFDNFPIVTAEDLASAVDSIRTSAQMLRVTWAKIERFGVMTYFKPEWERREILNWTMSFDWLSRWEKADSPFLEEVSAAIAPAADFAKKMVQKAIELIRGAFDGMDDYLIETATELEKVAKIAEVLASIGIEAVEAPMEVAERAARVCYTGRRAAYNLANQIRATGITDQASYMGWMSGQGSRSRLPPAGPPEGSGAASQGGLDGGGFGAGVSPEDVGAATGIGERSNLDAGEGSNRPGSIPRSWHLPESSGMSYTSIPETDHYISKVAEDPADFIKRTIKKNLAAESLILAAERYARTAKALETLLRPEEKVMHHVMKNEDLRRISVEYYGTADRWREIAKNNGIDGSAPDPGTKLLIYL